MDSERKEDTHGAGVDEDVDAIEDLEVPADGAEKVAGGPDFSLLLGGGGSGFKAP